MKRNDVMTGNRIEISLELRVDAASMMQYFLVQASRSVGYHVGLRR